MYSYSILYLHVLYIRVLQVLDQCNHIRNCLLIPCLLFDHSAQCADLRRQALGIEPMATKIGILQKMGRWRDVRLKFARTYWNFQTRASFQSFSRFSQSIAAVSTHFDVLECRLLSTMWQSWNQWLSSNSGRIWHEFYHCELESSLVNLLRMCCLATGTTALKERRFFWALGPRPSDFPGLKGLEDRFGCL